jgi:hypothetical protein
MFGFFVLFSLNMKKLAVVDMTDISSPSSTALVFLLYNCRD